jgi:transcription elongation factor/antiterminator RfaH
VAQIPHAAQRGAAERQMTDALQLAPGERWFVVQTLSKREPKAQFQLARQGFRVFLPVVMRSVRHARKVRNVKVAAFPGYLFVILDLQRDRWRSINGTIGVSRLVMGEASPLPAPTGIIEALLDYRDETGVCRFDRDLEAGQSVRIVSGPLAEAVGKLVRLDANGRVCVLLELLGGQVQATIARAALEAA